VPSKATDPASVLAGISAGGKTSDTGNLLCVLPTLLPAGVLAFMVLGEVIQPGGSSCVSQGQ
jgi:hypothetical protein